MPTVSTPAATLLAVLKPNSWKPKTRVAAPTPMKTSN
jgi:hypothetical protein